MRGHIRKRGKSYAIVLELPRDPVTNRRRQKWHSGYPSLREAQRALTKLAGQVDTGTYVAPTRQTLRGYLVDDWLPAIKDTVRPSTFASYSSMLELHVLPTLGDRRLVDIDAGALNALYGRLRENGNRRGPGGLSARSVNYVHVIVHRALKDAVAWHRLARNPADAARPPKASAHDGRAQMRTWTAADVARFLTKSGEHDDRYYPAWLTLATTGLRRGELLGLRWSDLDLERGRAQIRQTILSVTIDGNEQVVTSTPKTAHGTRSIALDPATVDALRVLRRQQASDKLAFGAGYANPADYGELVFCHPDGRPYNPDRFSREFNRRVERWGLPRIRLHDLRHGWATLALEAGIHPRVVQERLGHANINITLGTYSHVSPAMDASAADQIAGVILRGDQ